MAQTENGIYYPGDYSKVADIPEDMKKMAESVDEMIKSNKYDDTEIKQDISDIKKEQTTQNEQINKNKENITELQTELKELEEDIKANSIIEETEQAKSLYIEDANASRGILNVLGNAEQETRNGYNLINILNSSLVAQDKGVKIDISEDGYITANGTPTADYVVFIKKSIDDLLENGMTYSVWQEKYSQTTDGEIYSQVLAIPKEGSSGSQQYINSSTKKATFVVDKNNYTYNWTLQIGLRSVAGAFNNYKNRYMLYKGTDNKNFELYGASPSLDYPSTVKCLGDNKNLYPGWEIGTINGETGQIGYDPKYIRSIDFIPVFPNKEYTIRAYNLENINELNTAARMYNSNKEYLGNKYVGLIQDNSITFTLTNEDVRYVKIVSSNNSEITETSKVDIKLEKGNLPTSYSPYGQGSTEIKKINKNLYEPIISSGSKSGITYSIDEKGVVELDGTATAQTDIYIISSILNNKISKVQGKIVSFKANNSNFSLYGQVTGGRYIKDGENLLTDTEKEITSSFLRIPADTVCNNLKVYPQIEIGKITEYAEHQEENYILDIQQEMVAKDDYFDLYNKKEVHGWKKIVFDGINNKFTTSFLSNSNRILRYNGTGWDNTDNVQNLDIKSNLFKTSNSWAVNTIYGKYIGNQVALQVAVDNNLISTVGSFNTMLQERYNSGNPLIVYFKDAMPTELDLTESQIEVLEKLNKLRYYEGVNNIMTTEDIALLQAKYSQNAKAYIDNKIATLSEKILNL